MGVYKQKSITINKRGAYIYESCKRSQSEKSGILGFIETVGNKLPHPATIFVILCAGVVILSHVLASRGVSVTYEGIDRATNEIKEITVSVQSLLTPDGIRYILNH